MTLDLTTLKPGDTVKLKSEGQCKVSGIRTEGDGFFISYEQDETGCYYKADGSAAYSSLLDIIKPVKRKVEFWVNCYGDAYDTKPSQTRQQADAITHAYVRTACIHINQEYEEGEGLT